MAQDVNTQTADAKSSCRLAADEMTRRVAEVSDLLQQATEIQECDDGYVFEFPGNAAAARRLLEFINAERQCCPFISFELTFQPDQGPIGVRIGGSDKLKVLVRTLSISRGEEP